jgi:cell division protein FtsB
LLNQEFLKLEVLLDLYQARLIMNALPRYTPPPQPLEPSRQRVVRRRKRSNPHYAIALETSFKLGVNAVLAIVAVSALVKLIPYNLAQQSKLKEIKTEVTALEGRVDRLQADLNRQFDPQQSMSVMQAESNRVDPMQRQIQWLAPATAQLPTQPPVSKASRY